MCSRVNTEILSNIKDMSPQLLRVPLYNEGEKFEARIKPVDLHISLDHGIYPQPNQCSLGRFPALRDRDVCSRRVDESEKPAKVEKHIVVER
jgi:hypothetical protein